MNNTVPYLCGYPSYLYPPNRILCALSTATVTFVLGDERLVDEDEEEGPECDDDDTDDDEDDEEQEMRVFGECEELEDYDDEFDQAGIDIMSYDMILYDYLCLFLIPHLIFF